MDKYLTALLAGVTAIALIFIYIVLFGHGNKWRDALYLVRQVIPNLLASLLISVSIYYLIKRHVDEANARLQIINALQLNKPDAKLKTLNPDELKAIADDLEREKNEHAAKIEEALQKWKQSPANAAIRDDLENRLRDLYSKTQIIDGKVSNIKDMLAVRNQISDKDEEISRLRSNIANLNEKITTLKSAVKDLSISAEKISK